MFGDGGLDLGNVLKLTVDHAGTKWMVGYQTIISFDGAEWKPRPEAPLPERGTCYDAAVDRDGIMWFAHTGGVLSFDGKTWRNQTAANGFPPETALGVTVDRFNVKWAWTSKSLANFDGTSWTVHDPGVAMEWIDRLTVDMDNRIWIVWNSGEVLSVLDNRPGANTGTVPAVLSLRGNYPNPFNTGTSISFDLSRYGAVSLSVYDILGRTVRKMDAGKLPAGRNTMAWNGADDHGKRVSSGVYLYRVRFGGSEKAGRMLLLK